MDDAFSMRRWADWLVASTTDLDDGEQRWLALFMHRQLLQGRQIVESARSTGDALPQFALKMPKHGDMDYLRQVQAHCDFVSEGQLANDSPQQAERRTAAIRAFAALRVSTGEPSPALRDLTNRWIAGEIDDEEYRGEVQELWKID